MSVLKHLKKQMKISSIKTVSADIVDNTLCSLYPPVTNLV